MAALEPAPPGPAAHEPAAPAQAQDPAPPVFIIDAAFGFALQGLQALGNHGFGIQVFGNHGFADHAFADHAFADHAFADHGFGDHAADLNARELEFVMGAFGFAAPQIDEALAAAANRGRDAVIAERREYAAAADSGAAAAAAYAAAATANTVDPQNSHDTGVLASLRGVVERLRADQGANLVSLDSVVADIKTEGPALSEGRPDRLADALAVVERTRRGERVLSIGASDEESLRRVWQRTNDPRNATARAQLRQAVFDALVDAWETTGGQRHIVCVNGRTSRILAALVLLDWDKRNWNVKTLEQFKNEVFARTPGVLAAAAAAAAARDSSLRAAAAAWAATSPAELAAADPSEEDSARLAEEMRAAVAADVDALVAAQGLSGVLAQPVIDAVRLEAQAAIMV